MIAAHKCYAMTATTALTAQNTVGVSDIHYVPTSFVRQQIEASIDDIGVDVVKTGIRCLTSFVFLPIDKCDSGMLASAETVEMVATMLQKYKKPTSVIDPVQPSPP